MVNIVNNLIVNLAKQTNIQAPLQSADRPYWTNIPKTKSDTFEKQNASNDNKFTFKEALKNFANGIISPLKAIIKKPLLSLGILATTLVATQFIPVLVPVMAVGFGVLSVFELSKGIYSAVKEYKNGKYDNSEKAFEKIGSGLIGTVLTALGMKQSAKIAVEAKTMSKLNVSDLNILQKNEIAQTISKGSWFNALKENVSILTTKNGLGSVLHQLKPTFLKTRLADIMLGFNQRLKPEKQIEKFKKTPEGIRRANLTEEQLQKEVQVAYDKVFDELKIPEELRPKLVIKKSGAGAAGDYCAKEHCISLYADGYRNGEFNLEHIVMHEATHCKNSLLCAKLPKEQLDKIICDGIFNKLQNGEDTFVIYGLSPKGKPLIMQAPQFTPQMRSSFAQFAKNNLFKSNSELERMSGQVSNFVDDFITQFPDFVKMNGSNESKATEQLMNYIMSVPCRKSIASAQILPNVDAGKLSLLGMPSENLTTTVINRMNNIERNCISQNWSTTKNSMLNLMSDGQYVSSPEEVLCEQAGSKFMIKTILDKIKSLKESGQLTFKKELELLQELRKEQLNIDNKTFMLNINPILKSLFLGDKTKGAELRTFFHKVAVLHTDRVFYNSLMRNLKNLTTASSNESGVILSQTNL